MNWVWVDDESFFYHLVIYSLPKADVSLQRFAEERGGYWSSCFGQFQIYDTAARKAQTEDSQCRRAVLEAL